MTASGTVGYSNMYGQGNDDMVTPEERKETFILKAMEVHNGEGLDYSKVEYKDNRTKVCIIDPEYGEYWQTPSNHLKGHCHPMRRTERISSSKRCDFEELKCRFSEVHSGENLDYSKSEYVNMHTPILIIDHDLDRNGKEYGEYWQEPSAHLKGSGHPMKAIDNRIAWKVNSTESIVDRFVSVHGGKYDYSNVVYENYRGCVEIICPKHGAFRQTVENHMSGKGCPACGCSASKIELEICAMLSDCGVEHETRNRSVLYGKEIDIYCPGLKIGIEVDGLRWHSEWTGGKDRNYHLSKNMACERMGIRLIHVFEDEYNSNKELVLDKIRHIIGRDHKDSVYARKCSIKEIGKDEAKAFLEANHIQGFSKSTIYYGAFHCGDMVGCMTFRLVGEEWELSRFSTDRRYNCVGLGGKMFKHFVDDKKPSLVKSFADRRWTIDKDSNLYTKIGFKLAGITKPDYYYVDIKNGARKRLHKFGFRKQILHRKHNLPLSMSETEMVKALGYDRVWNCGLYKYIWTVF